MLWVFVGLPVVCQLRKGWSLLLSGIGWFCWVSIFRFPVFPLRFCTCSCQYFCSWILELLIMTILIISPLFAFLGFFILHVSSLSTVSQLSPHNLAIFSVNLSQGLTAVLHQKQAWISDSLNPKAKGYLGSQYDLTHTAQDFSAEFSHLHAVLPNCGCFLSRVKFAHADPVFGPAPSYLTNLSIKCFAASPWEDLCFLHSV